MAKKQGQTMSAKKRREQHKQQQQQQRVRLAAIVGIVAVLVLAGGAWLSLRNAGPDPTDEGQLQELGLVGVQVDGDPDAPIQVVEYGDFGCPACRQWHASRAKQQIKAQFGDDVAFSFRHFPVITAQSPKAAEAGQCAAEQDAFWQFHDYMYDVVAAGALGVDELKGYAADMGLDSAAFGLCLDSGKYTDYIREEISAAQRAGARGTPAFFINGEAVSSQPATMIATIESLLDG